MSGGRATGRWGIDPRRSLRWLGIATSLVLWCCTVLLFVTVATVEWRLATGLAAPGALGRGWVLLAFLPPGVASAALLTAVAGVLVRTTRNQRDPLPVLAERARQIASGDRIQIPYQDRVDTVGDLARALREWQQAATVREVLLRSAPVGIFWLSATGHVLDVNEASLSILGYAKTELQGRFLLDLVHPDEQYLAAMASAEALTAAGHDRAEVEARLLRHDGSWIWCSVVAAPVTMEEGPPAGFIIIIEDIGELRREAAWAAAVQREMLPATAPLLPGYDVAGRCVAARNVAGDLYDWVETGDGNLELTVADVMGKGMGAALVMAALRTALRTAPADLGPADRVTRAAASMTFGAETQGMFVTLFHGRLETATGRLRYVDAGHGYCLVRRRDGTIERLGARSLPLGLWLEEPVVEGEVRLDPGDVLMVCSDGLVEVGDATAPIEELVAELGGAGGAEEMVDRLLGRVERRLTDDATAVVVRRLGAASAAARREPGQSAAATVTNPPGQEAPHAEPAVAGATAPAGPGRTPSGPAAGEERLLSLFVQQRGNSGGFVGLILAATVVAVAEWYLGAAAAGLPDPGAATLVEAVLAPIAAGLPVALLVLVIILHTTRIGTVPVPVLAARARQIAAGGRVQIPYQDREDELGDLARALWEWQQSAAIREVLLRSAPVGICRVSISGAVVDINRAALAVLGYGRGEIEGRSFMDLVHPDDRHLAASATAEALAAAGRERAQGEARLRGHDGSWLWCSVVSAPVAIDEGPVDSFIVIIEDIGDRKRQAAWAAAVQREMLPSAAPELAGCEVAGSCLRAHELAGDLYDWVETDDGSLELTVADVMGGKGIGAALVVAALRTALRTAPAELGPADRVTRAAAAMTFGAETQGMFVTLFHGRLESATGRLRYVDAGHGYSLLRRSDGRVERLGARSLPLGLWTGEPVIEGEVWLEPGDVLLVCSDGLVEAGEGTVPVEDLAAELDGESAAEDMVGRLLGRVSPRMTDDATALVLRRTASVAASQRPLAAASTA